ncbi:MAG: ATP-binding protein, partial [Minisyncoccales bacterium]
DVRVSLINGFYGANASGKSTILNAIGVIFSLMTIKHQEFILGPGGIKIDNPILLPNLSKDKQFSPTILGIDFIINKNSYSYIVHVADEGKEIKKEILSKNGKNIFIREGSNVTFEDHISKKIGEISKDIIAPKNSSFLSVILDDSSSISVFGNMKETIGVSELKEIKNKTCFITDKKSMQGVIPGLLSVAIKYLNDNSANKEDYRNTLNIVAKYFEPNLKEIIIKKNGENSFEYSADYENFYKKLPVQELSAGTRELISYINQILEIIRNGGVIVYDETSKYYHPDMEIAILNLFRNKDINRNNAQIFFSSHNHETFDLLHNNQAYIMEKKGDAITVNSISDYDVKERDNIKKRYRLGSLGGVPDTIDFNRAINNLL